MTAEKNEQKEEVVCKEVTYLSGPIDMASDWGIKWRRKITPKLIALKIEVQDPHIIACKILGVSSPEASKERLEILKRKSPKEFVRIFREIREAHRKAVLRSTFLITRWDWQTPTYGTPIENYIAAENKIPIYCVYNAPKSSLPNCLVDDVERSGGEFFTGFKKLLKFLEIKKIR